MRMMQLMFRQRVHQMTEDVSHMTEDVPHMAEDAPEMTMDVQATVVEDLGRDGAEGSHADDAEGFLGGPRDPSVLTSFADHVAHTIWSGQEHPELKLVSHGRKVTLIRRPVPEIEGLVAATRLSPLIGCSVVTDDPGLISAFMESGAFHNFHALSVDEAIFLLIELLKVSAEEARAETARSRGTYSATYVHVVHLEAFRDLGQSGGYAWGVAVLVHMYDQLDEASRTTTRQIGGYLTLLQVSADYMEWFVQISRPFMIPTQAGDQPRHAPAPDHEDYMQPAIPQVPVAFDPPRHAVDDYEGYEAIAERLERVLNLRMVTVGTELHDIMQDCLTIAGGGGGASVDGSVRARQRRRTNH
ncbi:hypothetical protein HKD37_03G006654 [Glycine soja]